jgi:acylphosphatase
MKRSVEHARVSLKIEGRVQGVNFRAATLAQARRLGVGGWVMNCYDGSVEVLAEGVRSNVEQLVSWCKHGPPGAAVTDVKEEWGMARDEFHDFRIRR